MKKLSPAIKIPERPIFRGFDIEAPWLAQKYRRNLPHLRIEGATYFVTFRLADSIPRSVVERWQEEREFWLRQNGVNPEWAISDAKSWNVAYHAIPIDERKAFEDSQQRQFLIELDKCHGSCILQHAHNTVAKALDFFHGKRIWCGDYVVMPNHVHLLVQPFFGVELEEWLYSVKRFSSAEISKDLSYEANEMKRSGHFWQTESYDRIVRSVIELSRMRRYIANNPAKLRSGTFTLKQMPWLDEFTTM